MWKKNDSKKGFTLVELIVVLVILSILAAIMVPTLLGWIDKAKEKQAVLEARSAYLAAQALLSEEYGKNGDAPANIDNAAVQALAAVDGSSTWTTEAETGREAFKIATFTYTTASTPAQVIVYDGSNWTLEK